MRPTTHRLRRGLLDLGAAIYRARLPLRDLRLLPLGTARPPQEPSLPDGDEPGWRSIAVGDHWGARDAYAWLRGAATLPQVWRDALADPRTQATRRDAGPRWALALRLLLGRAEMFGWPEGLLYVNGRLQQGINQHHADVLLRPQDAPIGELAFDVYAWSGMLESDHRLEEAEIALLDRDAEALYHLLNQGIALVDLLAETDPLAYRLAAALDEAYNLLDMRQSGGDALVERYSLAEKPVSADDGVGEGSVGGVGSAGGVDGGAFTVSVGLALARLRERLADLRAEFNPAERPVITAVGHGHLDVAWLWRTTHTREKTARTFGAATALMEHYPDYHFLHTTPQVYDWLSLDYPTLFARVAERVREGRFEAAGAMWLEADTNLVSGESLVRQILYGQRYLRETFGAERANYDTLWLPDTFGYTAALPQIMLRSGLRAFMTTKMSWSDTNRIPTDTFRWRGLDGSATLAHFITTPSSPENPEYAYETYNGMLTAQSVRGLWGRYHDKAINDELLLAFGFGDGGAGPTRQHLEQAAALQELPGLPELRLGRADDYFHRLRARVWDRPDLPTWDGEMYFEYHRGTYTTQGWLKRLHRQNEARLLLAETLEVWIAPTPGPSPEGRGEVRVGGDGAGEITLDEGWRTLLLHEFHDILPGSSIGPVYADARVVMDELAARLDARIERALREIVARGMGQPEGVFAEGVEETDQSASALAVFNPGPWAQDALLTLPMPGADATGWAYAAGVAGATSESTPPATAPHAPPTEAAPISGVGEPLPTQPTTLADGSPALLAEARSLPTRGYVILTPHTPRMSPDAPARATTPTVANAPVVATYPTAAQGTDRTLENAFIRLRFDDHGEIVSCVDLRVPGGRELLLAGQTGNRLVMFDDRPPNFDAWDIDATFEQKPYPLADEGDAEIALVEAGPLRATLLVRRRVLSSMVEQRISLYRHIPRIDFATRIDWHEHHLLLKAAFPLDVRATQARSEIQYGSVERATHRNTNWDRARFETAAHRWVDLSEPEYGVSLLNDGRYGHDIHDTTLRLTLLRSPTSPDPNADQGEHAFTYSLYPHLGDWRAGGTVQAAYALNRPPLVIDALDGADAAPEWARVEFFTATPVQAVIEAIKRAGSAGADGTDGTDGAENADSTVDTSCHMLIVRVYEAYGTRCQARIQAPSWLSVAGVVECDLLERPLTAADSP
ncbi:MAG TPA: glycoside hydrolase family 38 C-terminal domain-containing protein, partial [Ktedonobacterales bacterium]|nr:glycoside hydrolase family 38 C-terminal domain-containing protein [Ktedonobacterales bacterium]